VDGTVADIKKLEGAMNGAADGPVSQGITLVQRLEDRVEKKGLPQAS
jgi:hypothetical protein